MLVNDDAEPPLTRRQLAFEVAAGITADVAIMINIVRKLYVAALFTLVTISASRA